MNEEWDSDRKRACRLALVFILFSAQAHAMSVDEPACLSILPFSLRIFICDLLFRKLQNAMRVHLMPSQTLQSFLFTHFIPTFTFAIVAAIQYKLTKLLRLFLGKFYFLLLLYKHFK